MAPSPAAILDAFTASTADVRARVLRYVEAAYGSLDSWRDTDIERFVAQVVPVIEGGQLRVAALTDAYLSRIASAVLEADIAPLGIPRAAVVAVRGVPTADVYARVGPTVWRALGDGRSLTDATRSGLTRALASAQTDLQLAKTHAIAYGTEHSPHVSGFARVPDGGACDLCLLAGDNTYSRGDLMPIHERCACDVEPLFGDDQRVASPNPPAPESDVEVDVADHGELGPVLVVAGQHFTSEDDF